MMSCKRSGERSASVPLLLNHDVKGKWLSFAFFIVLGFIFSIQLTYAIPSVIDFQGKLADLNNNPQTGVFNMTFSVYTQASGGSMLWKENKLVSVSNGLFSTMLGSNVPINFTFDGDYYVDIMVGTEVFAPRYRIGTVPYAFRANVSAYAIAGNTTTPSFIVKKISGQISYLTEWQDETSNVIAGVNSAGQFIGDGSLLSGIGVAATTRNLSAGNISGGTFGSEFNNPSYIFPRNLTVLGNFSVSGSANITSNLYVTGTSRFFNTITLPGGGTFSEEPGTSYIRVTANGLYFMSDANVLRWWSTGTGDTGISRVGVSSLKITDGTTGIGNLIVGNFTATKNLSVGTNTLFVDTSSGNVGIGTTSPLALLHVNSPTYPVTLGGNGPNLASNAYFSGGWKYAVNGPAELWGLNNVAGDFAVLMAPSGTAGSAITWTAPFTVMNSGNVGIGTTTPQTRLDVNGTLNATNITLTTNCADGQILKWSNGVGQCGTDSGGGNASASGKSGYIAEFVNGSHMISSPIFTDNNSVGIGTTNLTASLQVRVTGSTNPFVISNSTGGSLLTVNSTGHIKTANNKIYIARSDSVSDLDAASIFASPFYSSGNSIWWQDQAGTALALSAPAVWSYSGGSNYRLDLAPASIAIYTAGVDRLHVDASGNVGINTITPSAKLDVSGTNPANNLSLGVNNTLYVNGSSNRIGIGTANPASTLHVVGTANITSSLYIKDVNVTSQLCLGTDCRTAWPTGGDNAGADNTTLTNLINTKANQSDLFNNASRIETIAGRQSSDNTTIGNRVGTLETKQSSDNTTVTNRESSDNTTQGNAIATLQADNTTQGNKIATLQSDNTTQGNLIAARALPGSCPAGQVVQNTTTGGVECITVTTGGSSSGGGWTNDTQTTSTSLNVVAGNKFIVNLSSGYTGIGSTSPTSALSVFGNISLSSSSASVPNYLKVYALGQSWNHDLYILAAHASTSGDNGGNIYIDGGNGLAAGNAGNILLATNSDGFTSNGNVGIGIAVPMSRLHVNGSANITDSIFTKNVNVTGQLCLGTDCRTAWPTGGDNAGADNQTLTDAINKKANQSDLFNNASRIEAIAGRESSDNTTQANAIATKMNNSGGDFTGTVTLGGGFGAGGITLQTNGDILMNGTLYITENITNVAISTLNVNGSIIPAIADTFDLGSSVTRFANGYFSGSVVIGGVNILTRQSSDNTTLGSRIGTLETKQSSDNSTLGNKIATLQSDNTTQGNLITTLTNRQSSDNTTIANTYFTISSWNSENTTIGATYATISRVNADNTTQGNLIAARALPGSCPAGQVVQNTTTGGVECVPAGSGGGGGGNTTGSGKSGYIAEFVNDTHLISSPIFTDNTSIGIGTTSPTAKLEVMSAGTQLVLSFNATKYASLTTTSLGGLFIQSFNDSAGKGLIQLDPTGGGDGMIVTASNQDPAPYFSVSDTALMHEYIYATGGNVGIGTMSPAVKLDVNNSILIGNSNHTAYLISVNNDTLYLSTNAYYSNSVWTKPDADASVVSGVAGAGSAKGFYVYTSASTTVGTISDWVERFKVLANGNITMANNGGNVGIGTTTPQAKLDVQGTLNVTGNVYVDPFKNITFGYRGFIYDNGTALIIGRV